MSARISKQTGLCWRYMSWQFSRANCSLIKYRVDSFFEPCRIQSWSAVCSLQWHLSLVLPPLRKCRSTCLDSKPPVFHLQILLNDFKKSHWMLEIFITTRVVRQVLSEVKNFPFIKFFCPLMAFTAHIIVSWRWDNVAELRRESLSLYIVYRLQSTHS